MPFEGAPPSEKAKARKEKRILERLLSEDDREVLENGLRKLRTLFEKWPTKTLPTTILFPETAARPLVYAVKPLLDTLYQQKGIQPPEYQFVKTPKSNRTQHIVETYIETYGATEWVEPYLKDERVRLMQAISLFKRKIKIYEDIDQEYAERGLPLDQEDREEVQEKQKEFAQKILETQEVIVSLPDTIETFQKERANLLSRLKQLPAQDRLFIIDDYMHNATTFELMHHGLRSLQPDHRTKDAREGTLSWSYFTFYVDDLRRIRSENKAADPLFTDPDQYLSQLIDLPKGVRFDENFFIGTEDLPNYRGFQWRKPVTSENPEDRTIPSQRATGVKKSADSSALFVERSPEAKQTWMHLLRRELTKIGTQAIY
ncbi:hypothetical protein KBA73_00310 [Patescibacteria group bacterium]|nr:hypothetical protein [Patescibacteria group bacterium]